MKESSQRPKLHKLGNKGRPSPTSPCSISKQCSRKENPVGLHLDHLANCLICATTKSSNNTQFNNLTCFNNLGLCKPHSTSSTISNNNSANMSSSNKSRQIPEHQHTNNILTPNYGKFLPFSYHLPISSSSSSSTSSSNNNNGFVEQAQNEPQSNLDVKGQDDGRIGTEHEAGERLKPHHCPECGKAFKQLTHLNAHQSVHSGLKPFICTFCTKTFSRAGHLKRHINIHTNTKPYFCKICGHRFNQNVHLLNHLRKHSGEKPYACTLCGKKFTRNSYVQRHIRIHSGILKKKLS